MWLRRRSGDAGADTASTSPPGDVTGAMEPRRSAARAPRREGGAPTWGDGLAALIAALRLRCPRCGRGQLFVRTFGFTLHERCPICGLKFDRGDGYFTGALALNLLLAEVVATALWLPLAVDPRVPIATVYLVGVLASVGLPILGFRHTRAIWIALDRLINPVA